MARKPTGTVVEVQRKGGAGFALRFRAYGRREYLTLPTGTTREQAEAELTCVMADVRRGIWQPPGPGPVEAPAPKDCPTFQEFASRWYADHEPEWRGRTPGMYYDQIRLHLNPWFGRLKLTDITVETVDRYRAHKLQEGRLRPNTINSTLTRLAQILEEAQDHKHIDSNPARGKRRRCKSHRPRRASISAAQVDVLLEVAGKHRALLATAILGGGLRVSELTGLKWQDVDLANGKLTVAKAKTDAGVRTVELDPWLREELVAWKMSSRFTDPSHYVFPGRHKKKINGTVWSGTKRRDRSAVTRRVLYPAIERANVELAKRKLDSIPDAVTFHSLRRTFASLGAEAGVDAAWVAAQIGHASSRFTLDVYTDVRNRRESPAERIGTLIRGGSMGSTAQSNDSTPEGLPTAGIEDSALQQVESTTPGA